MSNNTATKSKSIVHIAKVNPATGVITERTIFDRGDRRTSCDAAYNRLKVVGATEAQLKGFGAQMRPYIEGSMTMIPTQSYPVGTQATYQVWAGDCEIG